MAIVDMEVPNNIIKQFANLADEAEEMIKEMTKAGAGTAASNARASAPLPEIAGAVKLTRVYRTPSDGGIATKVYISGYLPFKGKRKSFSRRNRQGGTMYTTDKGIPLDFLANLYEYGRSTAPFPKKPFFRKSFNHGQITAAMNEVQERYLGGME